MRRSASLAYALILVGLVAVRLPSLAQPAGADQGLYAYVGERILEGELPYRDAWDQKPPAIHATYALMFALWRDTAVIAAADLVVAVLTALLLASLGRRLVPGTRAGEVAAVLFLLLSNPAFARLGGARIRGQSEVFISLAVAAALLLVWRSLERRVRRGGTNPTAGLVAAGALIGLAGLYKYNALVYLAPAALALLVWPHPGAGSRRTLARDVAALLAGATLVVGVLLLVFGAAGALGDLYQATLVYNLKYSGETYGGLADFGRHLVTFPIQHARVDSLWWLGGLGTAVLLALGVRRPALLVVPAWVAVACLSIAVNGRRGLPQYFLQAGPPLALAAGIFLTMLWRSAGTWTRIVTVGLVATGVWRVTDVPKAVASTAHDVSMIAGRIDRRTYLARFGEPGSEQKYSALAVDDLGRYLRETTHEDERVLVFGFSQGALVLAERKSASRFFWSRPVVVRFNEGRDGYGVEGLLAELEHWRPRVVVLQRNDWQAEGIDSATFFLGEPRLRDWLVTSYRQVAEQGNLLIWRREAS